MRWWGTTFIDVGRRPSPGHWVLRPVRELTDRLLEYLALPNSEPNSFGEKDKPKPPSSRGYLPEYL